MEIKSIGIVGAGAMGAGIAQVFLVSGYEVLLLDQNESALTNAQESIRSGLNKLAEKGKMSAQETEAAFGKLYLISKTANFENCDLIIEAIVEDLGVKKALFKDLEGIVSDECILASNTSSLPITSIAAALQKPERMIGIHFFNPAFLMSLVEVIPALQTREGLGDEIADFLRKCDKFPVVVKDTPGFIVNRIARPFYGEAVRIYEEGIADPATIDWAMTTLGGFKMGPFALMDFIGHDVNFAVSNSVFKAFFYDARYKPSLTQQRMVEAGYLGKKSGKGFYDYSPDAVKPAPFEDANLGKLVVERIVIMLINEAADAMYLRIASRDDIDTAMTKGVNYPKGLLQWADEIGIDTCVRKLDQLYNVYHEERYRCSILLRMMAAKQQAFY